MKKTLFFTKKTVLKILFRLVLCGKSKNIHFHDFFEFVHHLERKKKCVHPGENEYMCGLQFFMHITLELAYPGHNFWM